MAIAGNILGEATPPAGNSFNEATRGLYVPFEIYILRYRPLQRPPQGKRRCKQSR